MAQITSEDVQALRASTGAGMMDCKRALTEAGGDMEKARNILRERGAASAAKRAGRATAEGLVAAHQENGVAVLAELNCETDFVAKTDDFQNLLKGLAKRAASGGWKDASAAPQDEITGLAAKLGENIAFRRFSRFERGKEEGVFGIYIHPLPPLQGVGKVGVLTQLRGPAGDDVQALAKDLSMQVAAAAPRWVRRSDVPAELLENEKSIARTQAKNENKPEKIWDKIIEGKLVQFYKQFCLLDQPFVKDASGKTAIASVVEAVSKKIGAPVDVVRFARFRVGEED